MRRREFLQLTGAVPLAGPPAGAIPRYRVVTRHRPLAVPGMPGPFPGRVARARSPKCIDAKTDKVDTAVVRQMLDRGICALTGAAEPAAAWRRFFTPDDVVGIKVN